MVRTAFSLLIVFVVLLGGIYPLVVLGVSQLLFFDKANGSLITIDGHVAGSKLLGQSFSYPKYFWSRPSATAPAYNAAASTGSNLSPANPKLLELVNVRVAALQKIDSKNKSMIPADLVTMSASGLDPHISLKAAEYQLARVARARGMQEEELRKIVKAHTYGFGAYVNVMTLNVALDVR